MRMHEVRPGARLGVDVGTVRVGIALSDPAALIATPLETVPRGQGDLERVAQLAAEHDATELVVGLPRQLAGHEGASAADARAFAGRLAQHLPRLTVRLVDERLSTVSADRSLHAAGLSGRRASTRRRQVLDQAAAVVILQSALDTERGTGRPPGQLVGAGGAAGDGR